ncbi:MAG: DNA gyrase subunit A [Planctomycetes bacterium RBG_16_43_13]|nr:MAG: DNA gyrase subunit A [Planctomycetes bacterium RBG_16_43_13]
MTTETLNIKAHSIEEEMKDSYLNYAMSVIVARALPDVRDGLKPSQRRILIAMNDLGLGPRAKSRKCAKIAGDTSGNYHPHGEQVVYPTLVRMAQDFAMRYTLVEGQGNFGSIDGDPPAAMRYTEARMTEFSMLMLEDLDRNTVDFAPNYDETREEPKVLPSAFPNLICCGSSGIAVGMATSIPPHNLSEVCDAIIKLIENPALSVVEIMRYIKGPDFPTAGIICGLQGLKDAYETGKGHITLRGKVAIEEKEKGKRESVIITEIPYNVIKAKLIEQIAQLVKDDVLRGISDIRDESDKEGIRIVIEISRGEDANVVVNQLYDRTQLQGTFAIIMIALVGNKPKLLNLKEVLELWRDHRIDVIRRRTRFLLEKAEAEVHILEGLAKALDFIDEVIAIIKKSESPAAAAKALIERFQFSEIQAEHILKMTLQRLTNLEQEKIRKDLDELLEKIIEYKTILADEKLILDIIREDIYEMKEKFGDKRRTEISVEEAKDFHIEELIPEEDMVVTLSHGGYLKRAPLTAYRKQKRGGKGIIGAETKEEDLIDHIFVASTHDYIMFFTEIGRVYKLKVYDIPELPRTSKGRAIVNVLEMKEKEGKIAEVVAIKDFSKGYLFFATKSALVKKTELTEYDHVTKSGKGAISLETGDKLIGIGVTIGEDEIMLGTADGVAARFKETRVRSMGRTAYGVKGMKFKNQGDSVVDMVIVDKNATLLTICENGFGKRTTFDEYRLTDRGSQGVKNIKTEGRNGKVVCMKAVKESDEIIAITQKGIIIRTPVKDIRLAGRGTSGVKVINLEEGDKVVSIARVETEEV